MKLLIFLLMGLLPLLTARGQEVVKTELVTVCVSESFGDLFIKSGEEVRRFGANRTGFSLPMAYVGPRVLQVHDAKEDFEPVEGAAPPKPVGAVNLPTGCDRVLLICARDAEGGLKMKALDIDRGKMKGGDYRFFNMSSKPLAVVFGAEKLGLKPGQDLVVTKAAWREEVLDIPVQMAIPDDKAGKMRRVYSSIWGHRPGKRNFIMIMDGRGRRALSTSRFFDLAVPSE
ncbi:MAG: hypothetical protein ACQKBY_09610 [Verrucomicrobiales bacterium]